MEIESHTNRHPPDPAGSCDPAGARDGPEPADVIDG